MKDLKFKHILVTLFFMCTMTFLQAQDRPKKGLQLILDVWNRVFTNVDEMQLLVVGVEKEIDFNCFNGGRGQWAKWRKARAVR